MITDHRPPIVFHLFLFLILHRTSIPQLPVPSLKVNPVSYFCYDILFTIMKDITNREAIFKIVSRFYTKAMKDETIGMYFTEIAQLDLEVHLPKIVSFWEVMLFGTGDYRGNPMREHFPLNRAQAMERKHFDRWIELWTETIDALYKGKNATEAKTRASHIANLMAFKMAEAKRREQEMGSRK